MNANQVFGHWSRVRDGLVEALDMVTDAQLDFVPREGLWSFGEVARHIANSEEGWVRHPITGELDAWPAQLTAADVPTVASIKARLAEVHARTKAFLNTVDADDLDRTVQLPWGVEVPLRWTIWHLLEHEIHHRGELYLMLGLMGIEAPDV